MIQIAHVIPTLAEWFGGPVSTALNLGAAQSNIGMKVSYWATGNKEIQDRLNASSLDARLFSSAWPRRWYRSSTLARELTSEISSFDLMELHDAWAYTSFKSAQIARRVDVPYIIMPNGIFMHTWRYRTFKKRAYSMLIGNRMLENAACLHVASEMEAEGCRKAGIQTPITIIPNGIDPDSFETLPDPEEAESRWPILKNRPVVLFVSRISRGKGLDQLIPLWSNLSRTAAYKDALLVIAGPDDYYGYQKVVENMIDSYNLGSKIFLTGMVRGREKLSLMNRADIFVLPSYSENFGIVVAEALACETPVITTTGTPWKQLQSENIGRWVSPKKSELGLAIRELLDMSESQRQGMGRRGRKLVLENYNWNTIVRRHLTLYNCILQGKEIPLHPEPREINIAVA